MSLGSIIRIFIRCAKAQGIKIMPKRVLAARSRERFGVITSTKNTPAKQMDTKKEDILEGSLK